MRMIRVGILMGDEAWDDYGTSTEKMDLLMKKQTSKDKVYQCKNCFAKHERIANQEATTLLRIPHRRKRAS